MTGSRMLRLGEAMSILARRTRGAVGELARLHAREEVEVFFDRAIAIRAVLAGLGQSAAILADLVGGEVVDVRLAGLDQLGAPIRRAGRNSPRRKHSRSQSKPSQRMSF